MLLGTGGESVRVSKETGERITAAAKQLRYTPNRLAQQLRGASSRTIGVIVDSINGPVMSQRLSALEQAASQKKYRLLIGQTHGQVEPLAEYVEDFGGRSVEAILALFDLSPGRDELVRRAFADFRRVVFHGRPAWRGGFSVRADTEAGIAACVDHLVALGRRRVALALWNSARDELMVLREKNFQKRLAEHGQSGFVWNAASEDASPTSAVLDQGRDFLVSRCEADAIIASNDIWATRLVMHLKDRGIRVPEDVAVIGYDNLDIATVLTPALTTVDQCHDDYAREAMELLIDVASARKIPSKERVRTITPRLIIRESTSPGV